MPRTSSKATSKRRPATTAKHKRAANKALQAQAGFARRAAPTGRKSRPAERRTVDIPESATDHRVPFGGLFGGVLAAYAEWPAGLAACRSPIEVWLLQVRIGARVVHEWQAATQSALGISTQPFQVIQAQRRRKRVA